MGWRRGSPPPIRSSPTSSSCSSRSTACRPSSASGASWTGCGSARTSCSPSRSPRRSSWTRAPSSRSATASASRQVRRSSSPPRSSRTPWAASSSGSATPSSTRPSARVLNNSANKWQRHRCRSSQTRSPPSSRAASRGSTRGRPTSPRWAPSPRCPRAPPGGAPALSVADGIARVHGLENCQAFEMLELPHDVTGLALNLESDNVGAVLFGAWEHVVEGDTVKRTGRRLEIPVGEALLGRIVSPLGQPLDGKGEIHTSETRPAEFKAPGVVPRQPGKEPRQPGLKGIDAMIPIGRGQRELIIGARQTGKTAIAVDTIINNKDTGVISVYVAIGQRMSTVVGLAKTLEDAGALDRTIIVAAPADEAAPIKFMAPYAGCAMAEYFLYKGEHALAVYDDLTKHAYAYRQMSLLLRRPPGREAYPGDVFYLHSRLLERAVKLNDDLGGGSLTALPIIETQAGDVAAYIPTNVISITDGQIFLEADLFRSGVRPAINVGISVSRVGGNAQPKPMKKVAGRLRLDLSQYRELEAFSQFGSDLDADTQATLSRGERLVEALNQDELKPWPVDDEVAAIYSGTAGYLDRIKVDRIGEFHQFMRERLHSENDDLMKKIADGDWEEGTENALGEAIKDAIDDFGPDFDEEGNPLEEGESDRVKSEEERQKEGRTSGSSEGDGGGDSDGAGEPSGDREEAGATA